MFIITYNILTKSLSLTISSYLQNDKRKMESEIRLLETTNKGLFEEIRQIRSSYDTKMEKLMKDFHIEIYKVGLSTTIFYFKDFMKQSAVDFVKKPDFP